MTKNTVRGLLSAICFLLMAFVSSNSAQATSVFSLPADANGGTGQTVVVPLSVSPGDGIESIDMEVTYDPAHLEVVSPSDVTVAGIAAAQGFELAVNIPTPGQIVIGLYATNLPLVGSGVVVNIAFHVLGAPSTHSTLGFGPISINEGGLASGSTPGTFTVTCANSADGTACNDGDLCTYGDACSSGTCVGMLVTCADDGCNTKACNGTSTCTVTPRAEGTACGSGPTECSNQDTCDGAGTCQPNDKSSGTLCGSGSTECSNQDTCNGTGTCQPNDKPDGTFCGDAGAQCTNQDTCLAGVCNDNGYKSDTTSCTGTSNGGACDHDAADHCSGTSGACVDAFKSSGTACGTTATQCEIQDTCNGTDGACHDNGFKTAGTACGDPSTSACDAADTCDGSGACQVNHLPDGTFCGDAGAQCTNQDTCLAGVCNDNGYKSDTTSCTGSSQGGACDNDAADHCSGTSGACVDAFKSSGTSCGTTATQCEIQDTCNGTDGACHDNGFKTAGTACGDPSTSACDAADTCDGSGACQVNHLPDGTFCGDAGAQCTNQDTCLAGVCNDNGYKSDTTSCTGSSQSGACDNDAADHCSGTSGACVDAFKSSGTACGTTATQCEIQDTCNGTDGACHDNGFKTAGTACGDPSTSECDGADTCDGAGTCQVNHQPDGTFCGDAGAQCTNQDTCLAGVCNDNGYKSDTTSCTGTSNGGACDNDAADHCSGTSGACVDAFKSSGTACGTTATQCEIQDTCNGTDGACHDNGFKTSGTACGDPSTSECDGADTCDGAGACQVNHLPDGTFCGDAGAQCTNQDTCLAGVCNDNGYKSDTTSCTGTSNGGACDNDAADHCSGTSGACVDAFKNSGTACGTTATQCEIQDTCNGTDGSCHDNGFKTSGTACGDPSTSECDGADTCDGAGACQVNHVADGTFCGDAGAQCTNQDTCLAGVCNDNGYKSDTTSCTGTSNGGACDNDAADHCSGTSGACVDAFKSSGTACGTTATQCENQDTCNGTDGACHDNGFKTSGTACGDPSTSECDGADTCDGAGACQVNHVADGTFCGDAGAQCTNQDTCLAGVCNDNGYKSDTTSCTGTSNGGACDNDAADHCSGTSGACVDAFKSSGTACGTTATQCEIQDTCNGTDGACHDNGFKTAGTACGDPSTSACDAADTCDGSGACQVNHLPDGTFCGDAGAQCTNQDTCLAGVCNDNGYKSDTTSCTGSSQGGACDNDAADHCSGTSGACVDAFKSSGTACGTTATQCEIQDTCNGTDGSCHDNGFKTAGTACGDPSTSECDGADTCDGAGTCQVNHQPDGTFCGDAGAQCTNQDTCLAGVCNDNGYKSDTTSCTGSSQSGACDNDAADHCSGTSGACVDAFKSSGTSCGTTATRCEIQDTCNGTDGACHDNGFKTAGTACGDPSTSACDAADTCDGSGACQVNHLPDGTFCGDAGAQCTNQDTCLAGVCNDNGYKSDTTSCTGSSQGGACDNDAADHCSGTSGACVDAFKSSGTACGTTATQCENQDTCNGTDGACHDNGFKTSGTACGDSSTSQCDNADTCDGAGTCQVNHVADGTACSDGNACTAGDACGGGTCQSGAPVVCNDNNTCTNDSCNPAIGCVYTPDDSNTCTDNDLCTTDTCSSGNCIHTPSGLCTVSGVVRYYRDDTGSGSEPSTKGVSATGIDRTGDAVADATTDGNGAFGLGSLVGNVTVTTVSKYGSPRAADANGGITSLDASFVARGRVGLLTLSANQVVAGDVTGDGSLSALDASEIARYAVRLVDHFDVAVATGSDWKYLRCDNYVNPASPGCVAPVYTYAPVTHAQPDTNFYAILFGDVTGNWRPATGFATAAMSRGALEEEKAAAADLEIADKLAQSAAGPVARAAGSPPAELSVGGSLATMRVGEKRQLTINLKNADGILGLDLSLKYDASRIAIVDVTATGIASGYAVAQASGEGKTEIAAYGLLPLSGSGQTLTVTVQALRPGVRGVPFSVSGRANEGATPMHVRSSRFGNREVPVSTEQ